MPKMLRVIWGFLLLAFFLCRWLLLLLLGEAIAKLMRLQSHKMTFK